MKSSHQSKPDEKSTAELGLALVDFHNFVADRTDRSGIQAAAEDAVDAAVQAFVHWGSVAALDIRFYGGWLDEDGHPSPNAQTLLATLPDLRGRRRGVVVRPELAMATMVEPTLRLHGTVRLRGGRRREKMVDQMIGCDMVFLAGSGGSFADIAVFSSDDDLIPPLLMANKIKPNLARWVRKQSTHTRPNDQRLRHLGLIILEI